MGSAFGRGLGGGGSGGSVASVAVAGFGGGRSVVDGERAAPSLEPAPEPVNGTFWHNQVRYCNQSGLGGFMRLHHVQVSIPTGGEDQARRFYGEALGLTEVDKPPSLAGRGGCWFRAFDGEDVVAEIHLGVDSPFVPARKAHPALLLDSANALEELGARLSRHGFEVSWADRHTFEGYERFHCRDPFGNRVEILSPPAG